MTFTKDLKLHYEVLENTIQSTEKQRSLSLNFKSTSHFDLKKKKAKTKALHSYFYAPPTHTHTLLWFLFLSSQHSIITEIYSLVLNGHFPKAGQD